jgi:hypothetical protein
MCCLLLAPAPAHLDGLVLGGDKAGRLDEQLLWNTSALSTYSP